MRSASGKIGAALVGVVMLAAACGNSPSGDTSATTAGSADTSGGGPSTTADLGAFVPVDQPGVTDEEIRVGGVTSSTNPLGGNYGDAYDGVEAYFAMVNDSGGIYQRELKLVSKRDDAVANNQAEVQGLLTQDDVFAVLPVATLLFTGAVDLASDGVPTFGWNIQPEWAEGPNLFGEKGSFLCFECTSPSWPWVASEIGASRIGILAYGISEQSKSAAAGFRASFEKYGTAEVAFFDDTLPFGVQDLSGEVAEMKAKGVDFVLTAMDQNGVRTLQLEMQRQRLDAVQYLSNAYDSAWVAEFGDLFSGSLVGIQFWPFEEETGAPEGMINYLRWMEQTGGTVNEISMAGWLSADLFVTGLAQAGPDFTQQKVIDGINRLTDWDANGLNPGFDWTIAHTEEQPDTCFALLEITPEGYVPRFGEPGKPFICLDNFAEEMPEVEIRS